MVDNQSIHVYYVKKHSLGVCHIFLSVLLIWDDMGNRKKVHKQKVAMRNARLTTERKRAYFPNLTKVLNIHIREGCRLMTWEHLIPSLNVQSPSADISIWGMVNRTRDGKVLNGSYVKTAEDKFKIFLNPAGFSSYIYRGEHKEYEHFEPSLQRALRKKETNLKSTGKPET